jgi:hypothetical protein
MRLFTNRDTEIYYPGDYTEETDYRLRSVWLRTGEEVKVGEVFLVIDLNVSLHWIRQESQPLANNNAPIEQIKEAVARGFHCCYYQCSKAIYHPASAESVFDWWEVTGDRF